jgi:hypothetical protein
MDFIEGFLKVGGKSVILTVVDRFSKYAHFIPLSHPYSASIVAKAFFDSIMKLHGVPCSIVSDRDPIFTSIFWKELCNQAGVKLMLSSMFHPQTDGQSEVVNRTIALYLGCLACDRPRSWLKWLPWAEFCYNFSYQTTLHTTPFQVVYGRSPPSLIKFQGGASWVRAVDEQLKEWVEFLQQIRERLLLAQVVMKNQHNKKHWSVEFNLGDWVWLRLQHRLATRITPLHLNELSPRFYGPY